MKSIFCSRKSLTLLIIAAGGAASVADAAVITVTNYSFELPSLPPGGAPSTSTSTVSQALDTAVPGWGVFDQLPDTGVEKNPNAADGVQTAYTVKGSAIYQDVGALLPNTTYTLTVATTLSPAGLAGGLPVIDLLNGVDNLGTNLVHDDVNAPFIGDLTVSYTTGATVAGDLTLSLASSAGFVSYDNVRLTAVSAVPLPAPLWLMLSGLGGLALTAKPRRRSARRHFSAT